MLISMLTWLFGTILFYLSYLKIGTKKTSLIFSIIVSPLSIYLYSKYPSTNNELYYSWYPAEYLSEFACAYFTYDLIICLINSYGIAFIIHAILSLIAYIFSRYGYLQNFGVFFLCYEISTIFLNLMHIQGKKGLYKKFYGWLFAITFFLFRIVIGTIKTFSLWNILIKDLDNNKTNLIIIILSGIFLLLNYYWMFGIIKKIILNM